MKRFRSPFVCVDCWRLFGVVAAIFVAFAVVAAPFDRGRLRAQDVLNGSDRLGGDFGVPFSLGGEKFGGFGGLDGVGALNSATPQTTVRATVVPVPKSAENYEFWRADAPEKAVVVGFLTLTTDVAPGWHIYSATQGPGGSPTTFDVSVESGGAAFAVGSVRLATPFQTVEAFGDALEELTGSVDWVAPIFGENGSAERLATAKIGGRVDALACSEGEGGACVPQKIEFSATFDPNRNATSVLDAAKKLAQNATKVALLESAESTQSAEFVQNAADSERKGGEMTSFLSRRFGFLLICAFLGGLILNATPCVLPVIGLKILSFFENAGKNRAKAFILNVWYALGVSIVFGALAFASVGLSFLFTRALFQILMSAIVFAMALSLIGVWELQAPAFLGGQKSNELIAKEGPIGAIFKGIVTTLLAIPCGAPLLSPVLDWASETTRQGEIGLVVVVYLTIGVGMASPFLLAGAFPELLKFFPKPGAWLETFRKTMGFFLLIAVVWILYSAPLEYQLPTTAFLFALWFACWNIGRNQYKVDAGKKKLVGWAVSLVVLGVVAIFSFNFSGNPTRFTLQTASENKAIRWAIRAERDGRLTQKHWKLFDRATLDAELAKGKTVVVDFTADWCMNCKFLEKTILHTPETLNLLERQGIVALTADWTNQNADSPDILAINELLDAQGARQVPKLMIFSPENPEKPIVLSGLYSKDAFLDALKRAENAEKIESVGTSERSTGTKTAVPSRNNRIIIEK